jgi:hypothetical protein
MIIIEKILKMFSIDSSKILNSEWTNTNGNKYYRLISTNEITFDGLNIDRTSQYVSKGGFSNVYKTIKYILMGLFIFIVTKYIPQKLLKINEIIIISISSTIVYIILDTVSPSINVNISCDKQNEHFKNP